MAKAEPQRKSKPAAGRRGAGAGERRATSPGGVPATSRPVKGVTVRMYRQGLGDCFLLTFPRKGAKPVHMLIDCGVHSAQSGGRKVLENVIRDIHHETGGRLDVVVATHEHTDHLSGFLLMDQLFESDDDRFQIGQLWLGWTEDRRDDLANALRKKHGHTLRALQAALKRLLAKYAAKKLGNPTAAVDETLGRLEGLMQFFATEAVAGAAAGGANADALGTDPDDVSGPELALEWLRVRAAETVLLRPGPPVVQLEGVGGVRVYVLGPPYDADALGVEEPSEKGNEIYLSGLGLDQSSAFAAAALSALDAVALGDEDVELRDLTYPFDPAHRNDLRTGRDYDPWLAAHYSAVQDEWRTVDVDWLHAAEGLALALDADTNNTSLALAIEVIESGSVLFFVADAQYGNWHTWKELRWTVDGKTVRVEDLLAKAVFYKVGHHASHNGTLRTDGLEKMGDDLVAMIPVDQAAASKLKGWKMPHEPLYKRLMEKTGGRLFRSDQDCQVLTQAAKPIALSTAQWTAFRRAVQTPLYFEITFDL